MFAKRYQRISKKTGLEDKPTIQEIFAMKYEAAKNGQALKKVYLTEEEHDKLKEELKRLEEAVNFLNMVNDDKTIEDFLGVPIEVMDDKVA